MDLTASLLSAMSWAVSDLTHMPCCLLILDMNLRGAEEILQLTYMPLCNSWVHFYYCWDLLSCPRRMHWWYYSGRGTVQIARQCLKLRINFTERKPTRQKTGFRTGMSMTIYLHGWWGEINLQLKQPKIKMAKSSFLKSFLSSAGYSEAAWLQLAHENRSFQQEIW